MILGRYLFLSYPFCIYLNVNLLTAQRQFNTLAGDMPVSEGRKPFDR